MKERAKTYEFEGVDLLYKNFSGSPTKFNRDGGDRKFSIKLTDDLADDLIDQGLNVKRTKTKIPGEIGFPYIDVKIKYNGRQSDPVVEQILYGKRKKTLLDQDTIGSLDFADIITSDIVCTEYQRDEQSNKTLYLRHAYITIDRDRFASKYDF